MSPTLEADVNEERMRSAASASSQSTLSSAPHPVSSDASSESLTIAAHSLGATGETESRD